MTRMQVLHRQMREAYGARRMWRLLNRIGERCGRHRVARRRRMAGIVALRRSFQSPVFFFELTESPQFSHAQWAYFIFHA